MAALEITITVESDPVLDALAELSRIHAALCARHGAAFRALDRSIDAILEGGGEALVGGVKVLGPGLYVFTPAAAVIDVLRRARELGV